MERCSSTTLKTIPPPLNEALEYTIIKVARDEDLKEQIGKDIYFDLVNFDRLPNFYVRKQTPLYDFKKEVAEMFGKPVQSLRFWIWAKRKNHTYRLLRSLKLQDEEKPVGHLLKVPHLICNAELGLFLEEGFGPGVCPIPPTLENMEDIILFFKLYDPEKGELRYVGRLFVKRSGNPIDIIGKLNQMAGFATDEEIVLYEEIHFKPNVMCVCIDKRISFEASEIEDGDIICFQKSPPFDGEECQYPDVTSFLEHVHNLQIVYVRSLKRPDEDNFCLEWSKDYSYDDVVEKVARYFGLDDPSKIRLTYQDFSSQTPKNQPIKYQSDMLVHYNQTPHILYYEVLGIPLPELEGLENLKVTFHNATKAEDVTYNIWLPKESTVGDVINTLKTKVELSQPNTELRLFQVFYHKIYKIFPHDEKVKNLDRKYSSLHAEEISEEEKNLDPNDRLILVSHFSLKEAHMNMQAKNFGKPFLLVIHERETLAEVKVRIQKKLNVPDEKFSEWKFAPWSENGPPEYLQDCDIVSCHFQRRDVYGVWESAYLGWEHFDMPPEKVDAVDGLMMSNVVLNEKISPCVQLIKGNQDQGPSDMTYSQEGANSEELPGEVLLSTQIGALMDFRGLVQEGKAFAPLLEEVCLWHPSLIECQQSRSRMFTQWAFSALGRVLHFLKTTKGKEMTKDGCEHLRILWEELETFKFDLTWLEPHVQFALGMKTYLEKAEQVKKLKDNVSSLEIEMRRLKAKVAVAEVDLEVARRDLAKVEEGFEEMDVNNELGYRRF
ncbi:ubiquitin carboxyl-terminal hydrolase 12 [Quillaja saponaria]|uniref:ubiquitinyl hydrolase 1 n=1 Tax=Quillaja saponaria TaxID=32244 RepID=A0AAD7Q7M2_QUISA|nr:ubiquitin carboxyl-terminal hydrolase 12 [Quillaja saponaria]